MRLGNSKREGKMNFGSTENFLGCKFKIVKSNGMKIVALTCLLLSSVLTGCDKSGPLAKFPQPDVIRFRSQTITNKEEINRFVSLFDGSEKRWRHYWITLPNPEVIVDLQKNEKLIASVFIGSDWTIVKVNSSDSNVTYSTVITKEEHKDLFLQLGIKEN
jgi:hypothetical protein